MRAALLLTLVLPFVSVCQAQQPPAAAPSPVRPELAADPVRSSAIEKRTERIRIEDAGSRIDELRVGGETRTISVTPKGGMPAYQVQPGSGERSWKILGF